MSQRLFWKLRCILWAQSWSLAEKEEHKEIETKSFSIRLLPGFFSRVTVHQVRHQKSFPFSHSLPDGPTFIKMCYGVRNFGKFLGVRGSEKIPNQFFSLPWKVPAGCDLNKYSRLLTVTEALALQLGASGSMGWIWPAGCKLLTPGSVH